MECNGSEIFTKLPISHTEQRYVNHQLANSDFVLIDRQTDQGTDNFFYSTRINFNFFLTSQKWFTNLPNQSSKILSPSTYIGFIFSLLEYYTLEYVLNDHV